MHVYKSAPTRRTAIDRASTSVDREESAVCVSPAVGVCRPDVELLSDLNPSVEEAPLQHTH